MSEKKYILRNVELRSGDLILFRPRMILLYVEPNWVLDSEQPSTFTGKQPRLYAMTAKDGWSGKCEFVTAANGITALAVRDLVGFPSEDGTEAVCGPTETK